MLTKLSKIRGIVASSLIKLWTQFNEFYARIPNKVSHFTTLTEHPNHTDQTLTGDHCQMYSIYDDSVLFINTYICKNFPGSRERTNWVHVPFSTILDQTGTKEVMVWNKNKIAFQ